MDRCYDIIILLTLRRPRVSDFAGIIKIVARFVKKTLKDSKKVKRIKNYVIFISTSWYNKNCWFQVKTCWCQQAETVCHVIHIFFGFSLGKVNCHLCRICVTNFREGASPPSASSYKRPILNRVSIDEGNLHIFRKTPDFFRILMKFSEKICLMLKVTEILGFTLSLYKMQFWKS